LWGMGAPEVELGKNRLWWLWGETTKKGPRCSGGEGWRLKVEPTPLHWGWGRPA
jgi:hypothetical protein